MYGSGKELTCGKLGNKTELLGNVQKHGVSQSHIRVPTGWELFGKWMKMWEMRNGLKKQYIIIFKKRLQKR